MAWDTYEENSFAWLTRIASEHGGVEQFINDIVNEAKCETQIEDWKKFLMFSPVIFALGFFGNTAYDKLKQKCHDYNELKRKSKFAKEVLKTRTHSTSEPQVSNTNLSRGAWVLKILPKAKVINYNIMFLL